MKPTSDSRTKSDLLKALRSKAARRRQELLGVANKLPVDVGGVLTSNIQEDDGGAVYEEHTLESMESTPKAELNKSLSPPETIVKPNASGRRRASSIVNRTNLSAAMVANEILRPPLSIRQDHRDNQY